MDKVLDGNFKVNEFELQSRYYVHFWERYGAPYGPIYGLDIITAVLLQEWLWH